MKCLEKGETFLFLLLFPAIPETGIWKKKETWDHEEKYHHLYEKIAIPASVFKIISTNHRHHRIPDGPAGTNPAVDQIRLFFPADIDPGIHQLTERVNDPGRQDHPRKHDPGLVHIFCTEDTQC